MAPARLVLAGLTKTMTDGARRFTLSVADFEVSAGEAVALVGPSGSGKTTLLEILGLVASPGRTRGFALEGDDGTTDVAALWARGDRAALARLRARRFGFVLQTGGLFGFLDARANAALPSELLGAPDPARVDALLERLGLAEVAGLRPARLSIGQRQRVAVARALAHGPSVVVADEPTSALDPASADDVLALLLETAAETGAAVVLSSHNMDLIARHGLRVARIVRRPAPPGDYASALEAA
jgi:putative ABC transport system ATP-binding protein